MKKRILLVLCALLLVLTMTACGSNKETTLTGMVVSVEGTTVSLMEFSEDMMERPAEGEMPDMENFQGFGGFDPSQFGGEGFDPENFDPENFDPENFGGEGFDPGNFDPENFDGTMPEMPEGAEMPAEGQMPNFTENFEGESTTVDIADAHISVEIDGGKAGGSMEDIKVGSMLTVTMNGKGEVTNVLVSSSFGFGGAIPADR